MSKKAKGTIKISKNLKETGEIAKVFLEEILEKQISPKSALVVGLVGNLGAGKTAFFQVVAKRLGIKGKVSSPTFVIMKKYPLKNKKYDFLFHLDAYRLKNEEELLHLGWQEIINNKKYLIFIEWPENVSKIMPVNAKYVYIDDGKNGQKHFKFK
jgi:tRNA threonylcarbamoyladenosine biosynthesis protein TsaE